MNLSQKSNKFSRSLEKRYEKRKELQSPDSLAAKVYRKHIRPIKIMYYQLKSKYSEKDLITLYDMLGIKNYWYAGTISKGKDGDKIYELAKVCSRFDFKKYFIFPLEDLPLALGIDSDLDKIVSWRFKIGV
jgi:hypothetical protein